jgi:hypothetical protein
MKAASLSSILILVAVITACVETPVPPAPEKIAAVAEKKSNHRKGQARVPNEYLVILEDGVDQKVIAEHFERFGIKSVSALSDEAFLVIVTNDPGPQEMENMIDDDSNFKSVQPNLIYWANRSSKAPAAK